jgi:hypothetical protein
MSPLTSFKNSLLFQNRFLFVFRLSGYKNKPTEIYLPNLGEKTKEINMGLLLRIFFKLLFLFLQNNSVPLLWWFFLRLSFLALSFNSMTWNICKDSLRAATDNRLPTNMI